VAQVSGCVSSRLCYSDPEGFRDRRQPTGERLLHTARVWETADGAASQAECHAIALTLY
jgi:hypothetical protein